MDFAAAPSTCLCIYIHSDQHTYRTLLCHGELMTIQKLDIGREIVFVRLWNKPYVLKAHRFYKAKSGKIRHGCQGWTFCGSALSPLSVRVTRCILYLCKYMRLESKMPVESAIVNNAWRDWCFLRIHSQHRGIVEMSNGCNRLLVGQSRGYLRMV